MILIWAHIPTHQVNLACELEHTWRGQDVSEVHYNDACDGDTDCADDIDREDDNMSHHLPLLIQLLNLNTLERADLGMYRRLLDITKEE